MLCSADWAWKKIYNLEAKFLNSALKWDLPFLSFFSYLFISFNLLTPQTHTHKPLRHTHLPAFLPVLPTWRPRKSPPLSIHTHHRTLLRVFHLSTRKCGNIYFIFCLIYFRHLYSQMKIWFSNKAGGWYKETIKNKIINRKPNLLGFLIIQAEIFNTGGSAMAFQSNSCFHTLKLFQLLFSLVLQTVCLSTPGWKIEYQNDVDLYYGIFYVTQCNHDIGGKTQCKTESYHYIFNSYANNGIHFIYSFCYARM